MEQSDGSLPRLQGAQCGRPVLCGAVAAKAVWLTRGSVQGAVSGVVPSAGSSPAQYVLCTCTCTDHSHFYLHCVHVQACSEETTMRHVCCHSVSSSLYSVAVQPWNKCGNSNLCSKMGVRACRLYTCDYALCSFCFQKCPLLEHGSGRPWNQNEVSTLLVGKQCIASMYSCAQFIMKF